LKKESSASILVILYPGCIFFEIALAIELLAKNFEIIFVTPDGLNHQASNGSTILVAGSFQQADLSRVQAVLVPGGNPGSIKDNTEIDKLLQSAHERHLWIAAICAGPLLLAKENILKNRKIAHGYGLEQLNFLKSYFEGVQLTNENFVCDGRFITAKAEAHIDFAVEIATRLGAADATKAGRLKDYYRGI
jgi:putative intracellular protease/amidase